jgi:hypothetical protein
VVERPPAGNEVTTARIPEYAFVASGASVVGSIPLTAILPLPDLPGLVVIVTGVLASVLSYRRRRLLEVRVLVCLVAAATAMVALHRFMHRQGVSHDWLEPRYIGAVIVYGGMAIAVGRRLLSRDAGVSAG